MAEADLQRLVGVRKTIKERKGQNSKHNPQVSIDHLKDCAKTWALLEQEYHRACERTRKHMDEVERLKEELPRTEKTMTISTTTKTDLENHDDQIDVVLERHKVLVTEEEELEEKLMCMEAKKNRLELEVTEIKQLTDSLAALHDEQDALLSKLCKEGNCSSDLERQLEELDSGLDKRERVVVAEYKWTNARVLLDHAVKQLGVACAKWISLKDTHHGKGKRKHNVATQTRNNLMAAAHNISSAQRYLDNITFPYCQPAEMDKLGVACDTIHGDMLADNCHLQASNLFNSFYTHASALLQWFDRVINNTINKDLETATAELVRSQKALRVERLRLIKDRFGIKADDLEVDSSDFDDNELEPELDFDVDDTESEEFDAKDDTMDTELQMEIPTEPQNAMYTEQQNTMHTEQQNTMYTEQQNTMHTEKQNTMYTEHQNTMHTEKQNTMYTEQQNTMHTEKQNTMYTEQQNTMHTEKQNTMQETRQQDTVLVERQDTALRDGEDTVHVEQEEGAMDLPVTRTAPHPPSQDLFGSIQQLKQQYEKERAEFDKRQETNKVRLQMRLQEKLTARRERSRSRME